MSTIRPATQNEYVKELKELFSQHLRHANHLKRPEGCATGINALDQFLFWGGLPKGSLSLLRGPLGSGSTSLWIESAALSILRGRWVSWINGDVELAPLSLYHKGVNLSQFVSIDQPHDEKKLLWLLQELMSSSLFEMIGCDLGTLRLHEHQIRKLQIQARQTHTALTFLVHPNDPKKSSGLTARFFSLIINFERNQILIERAVHRPTPYAFARSLDKNSSIEKQTDKRSVQYARFTLHTKDRIGLGTDFNSGAAQHTHTEPNSLPETSKTLASRR